MNRPRFDIALVAGGEPFHGASPEMGALGGSETAAVQMARALAGLGHSVRVYCSCPRPGDYNGVIYADSSSLTQEVLARRFDVVVISRMFPALDLPWRAGLKVLWNHDILDRPRELAARLDQLDLALVLSRFHAQNYLKRLPALGPKLAHTRNGLDIGLLESADQGVSRTPGRVVYASRPERGLELLLARIWSRLLERLPHLELQVCGYAVGGEGLGREQRELYARIDKLLADAPRVVRAGHLAKPDYYALLASADALLYPCVFPEISCIAALEAQALGAMALTSDSFALSESVINRQFLTPGRPGSGEYVEAFVDNATAWLGPRREDGLALVEKAAPLFRQRHDWQTIAQEWQDLFAQRLEERISAQAEPLAASLALHGDRVAAAGLLGRPLTACQEPPPPRHQSDQALYQAVADLAGQALARLPAPARVGVLAQDARLAARLEASLPGATVIALNKPPTQGEFDLMILQGHLEHDPQPHILLQGALAACREEGYLLAVTASGAWPLVAPGRAARVFDLGAGELARLLPGRELATRFIAAGLVRSNGSAFSAGHCLALAPAAGPPPRAMDPDAALNRVPLAPAEVVREVTGAGLV